MKLLLAIKAFFKAFRDPAQAQKFVEGRVQEVDKQDQGHLRLLAIFQQSGRLIDFFKEDITNFSDAQVGAAVRKIHQDCNKVLEDAVTVRPIMEENEGDKVTILPGYDPAAIKVVGNIKGEPPFTGILTHKGWKAHKRSLPKKIGEQHSEVLCPAEIEVR
jgi:Domain of unknown function (DUF2760)